MTSKDTSSPQPESSKPAKKIEEAKSENALLNILFNIAIPVFILNKGSEKLGPENAVLVALAFPFFYGAYDFFKRRKMNWIALLGLLNVAFTGGFALTKLSGFWFAIKEAFFPALIGIFVFASSWTKTPFIKRIFMNPQLMNLELIEAHLLEKGRAQFDDLLKRATLYFSGSFFISAALNYGLAFFIFKELPSSMTEAEQSTLLNEQIAQMTQWSFVVIMLPSMIILGLILWYFIRGLERTTGIPKEQLFKG